MSVVTAKQELSCFFCHIPIVPEERCVEWQGSYKIKVPPPCIHLHPKCAVMLATRLIGDAFAANPTVSEPESVLLLVESRMKFGG